MPIKQKQDGNWLKTALAYNTHTTKLISETISASNKVPIKSAVTNYVVENLIKQKHDMSVLTLRNSLLLAVLNFYRQTIMSHNCDNTLHILL